MFTLPRKIFKEKRILFLIFFIFFSTLLSSSDFDSSLNWIKKKSLATKRFNQEEFKILKPYLQELLKKNVYKEDIYAILVYLSQERLSFKQILIILKEISALLKVKDIPSKKLRNFIFSKIKIAKINGIREEDLVIFLIEEIYKFRK